MNTLFFVRFENVCETFVFLQTAANAEEARRILTKPLGVLPQDAVWKETTAVCITPDTLATPFIPL